MKTFSFLIMTFCFTLLACERTDISSQPVVENKQTQSGLVLKNAYIPYRSDAQQHFAAYFELENATDERIQIIDAHSPAFAHVMLHETIFEDGMAKMKHIESLNLNKGEAALFKPKGKHVMLMQPQRDFSKMEGVYLILELADGQKIKYEINFKKI